MYVFEEEAGRFARAKATFFMLLHHFPPYSYENMFFDLQKDLPAPMSGHCMLTLPGGRRDKIRLLKTTKRGKKIFSVYRFALVASGLESW